MKVKAQHLEPGDTFTDGDMVLEVWIDPEGVWVDSTYDAGYYDYDQRVIIQERS